MQGSLPMRLPIFILLHESIGRCTEPLSCSCNCRSYSWQATHTACCAQQWWANQVSWCHHHAAGSVLLNYETLLPKKAGGKDEADIGSSYIKYTFVLSIMGQICQIVINLSRHKWKGKGRFLQSRGKGKQGIHLFWTIESAPWDI